MISSGDAGAAGCDVDTSAVASGGLGVNALCSSPYDVCVGGTEFNDFASPIQFWSAQGAALGYIPEEAWNESGKLGSGLFASGGGYSILYPRSSVPWQTGNAFASRGVPDVSLSAALHDGYLVCETSSCDIVYGTSAASPSFAGIMALVSQSTGQRQGNPNPILYALAARSGVFHDVVSGNNSVPGQNGYTATTGWDPVTGLGSVDANALVANWGAGLPPNPSLLLSANSVNFGTQTVGTSTSSRTVVVSSNGTSPVNISSIQLQGAATGDFPSTTTCPKTGVLSPAQTCSVTVTFNPATVGLRSASVAISDSGSGSPHTILLSGTGIAAPAPPTLLHSLTAISSGISTGYCSQPAAASTFSTSSPFIWLYFDVNGANLGDAVKITFIRPDGIVYGMLTSTSSFVGYECFSFYEQLAGSSAALYPGKWTVQGYWNQFAAPIFTLNFTVAPVVLNGPMINANGIVNSASQADGATSGGFISIYGTQLSTQGASNWNIVNNQLPTTTAGTQVLIDVKPAYLSYVSPTLINAIVPSDPAIGVVSVQVITSAGVSPTVTVNKKPVAPALFTIAQGGAHYAAATLPDGILALPTGLLPLSTAVRGAKPGEVIALWANGLGPTSPVYPDGQVVTSQNRGVLASTYSVSIGGKPAVVEYAGLVGSGLYQVNCLIPQIASGDASVVLTVAGASSSTAYIYVGQ